MRKIAFPIIAIVLLLLMVAGSGCDPYRKLAKSDKIADKDTAAVKYYNDGKYDRAVYLFEELIAIYRQTERMEEMYYYYAYCRYFLGELVSAAYYFDDFSKKFPNSEHAEECEYMTAKCYYLLSDPHYLDQKYTYKAIEQFQLFLSRNPYAEKKDKCTEALTELRERLAKKAFEQASLYHKIGYHKAAVEAFHNMINEFPDSKFREEAQFLLFKSAVNLAGESVDARKLERYQSAVDHYEKFEEKFPDSKFAKEAENLKASAEKSRQKMEAEEKEREQEKLFNSIRSSVETVLATGDPRQREKEYEKALDTYRQLQDTFPDSSYLAEADDLFKKIEAKQEKEN